MVREEDDDENRNSRPKSKRILIIAAIVFCALIFIIGLSVGLSKRNRNDGGPTAKELAEAAQQEQGVAESGFEAEEASETAVVETEPTAIPISTPTPTSSPFTASTTLAPVSTATTKAPSSSPATNSPTISVAPSISDMPSMVPTEDRSAFGKIPVTTFSPTARATDGPTAKPTSKPTEFKIRQQWTPSESGNGIRLEVQNAMSTKWDDVTRQVLTDWERGTPDAIQFTRRQVDIDPGCTPVAGVIKLCNSDKGNSGGNRGFNTLVLSQQDGQVRIAGATVEMNDFHLATERLMQYNLCQFVGHALGLQILDEDYFNAPKGSCMDYSNNLSDDDMLTPSEADYQQLAAFYGTFRRVRMR